MDTITVYSPDGEAHVVTPLNAMDLTRMGDFSFKKPVTASEVVVPVDVTEPVVTPTTNNVFSTLEVETEAVTGKDSIEEYLNTKDVGWLRTYAEKTYGEKVHGRTGKDKIIEMILGWEESKLAEEPEA